MVHGSSSRLFEDGSQPGARGTREAGSGVCNVNVQDKVGPAESRIGRSITAGASCDTEERGYPCGSSRVLEGRRPERGSGFFEESTIRSTSGPINEGRRSSRRASVLGEGSVGSGTPHTDEEYSSERRTASEHSSRSDGTTNDKGPLNGYGSQDRALFKEMAGEPEQGELAPQTSTGGFPQSPSVSEQAFLTQEDSVPTHQLQVSASLGECRLTSMGSASNHQLQVSPSLGECRFTSMGSASDVLPEQMPFHNNIHQPLNTGPGGPAFPGPPLFKHSLNPDGSQQESFSFQPKYECLDWRKIGAIDVDRLIIEVDLTTLQEAIKPLTVCNIACERCPHCRRPVDPDLLKLIRLAQCIIEYLLHCQQCLTTSIKRLEESLRASKVEAEQFTAVSARHTKEIQTLKEEFRKKKKAFVNQLQILQNNSCKANKCQFCDKAFLNSTYLQNHIQRRHPEEANSEQANTRKCEELQAEVNQLKQELQQLQEIRARNIQLQEVVTEAERRLREHEAERRLSEHEAERRLSKHEAERRLSEHEAERRLSEHEAERRLSEHQQETSAAPDPQDVKELLDNQENTWNAKLVHLQDVHKEEKNQLQSEVEQYKLALQEEQEAGNARFAQEREEQCKLIKEQEEKIKHCEDQLLFQAEQSRVALIKQQEDSDARYAKEKEELFKIIEQRDATICCYKKYQELLIANASKTPEPAPAVQESSTQGATKPAPAVQERSTQGATKPATAVQESCTQGAPKPAPAVQECSTQGATKPAPAVQECSTEGATKKDQLEDTLGTSKEQLADALKTNPTLGQELRAILEQGLNEKLQALGIQTNVRAIPSDCFDKVINSIEVNREQKEKQEPCIHQIRKHLECQVSNNVQRSLSSNRVVCQMPITIAEGRQNVNQECGPPCPTYICKLQLPSRYASNDSCPSEPKTPPLTSDDEREKPTTVLRFVSAQNGCPPDMFLIAGPRCSSQSVQSDAYAVRNEECVPPHTQREAEKRTVMSEPKAQECKRLKPCLKHVTVCAPAPTDTDSHGSEVEDNYCRSPRPLMKKTTCYPVPKRPYKRTTFISPVTSEQSDSDSGCSVYGPRPLQYHSQPPSPCCPVRGPVMQDSNMCLPFAQPIHGFDRRSCGAINITKEYLKKDEKREHKGWK
ncbi:cilium assembly protein DZIP1-like [Lissotriton helveticus]